MHGIRIDEGVCFMNHTYEALSLFSKGYNCAQAVAGAFAQDIQMSQEDICALASGFGGGIAGMRATCGTEIGALLILGKVYFDPENPETKNQVSKMSKELIEQFKERNDGEDQCKDLLRRPTLKEETNSLKATQDFPNIRPCAKYVIDCVELLESFLENH